MISNKLNQMAKQINKKQKLYVQQINGEDVFIAMRDEWNRLLCESDCDILFLTHEWVLCWWRHFGQYRPSGAKIERLLLAVRSEDGQLCGLAPFIITRYSFFGIPLRVVGFLGEGTSDYSDLIVSRSVNKDLVCDTLIMFLADQGWRWDVIDLRNLYADSNTLRLLKDAATRAGWSDSVDLESFCRYIPIQGEWDAYYSQCSSAAGRRAHRKEWRRLNTVGPAEIKFVDAPSDLYAFLEMLAEVESHHPDIENARPGFMRTYPFRPFIEEFLFYAAPNDWLKVALLECSGLVVAYYLSFLYKGRYYAYLTSYRKDFKRFGVGRLTFIHMLEHFWNSGADEIDLLRGEERYKSSWAENGRQNQRLTVARATLRSRMSVWLWKVALVEMEHRLPRIHNAYRLINDHGWASVVRRAFNRLTQVVQEL